MVHMLLLSLHKSPFKLYAARKGKTVDLRHFLGCNLDKNLTLRKFRVPCCFIIRFDMKKSLELHN
jgi:hypothetical protein